MKSPMKIRMKSPFRFLALATTLAVAFGLVGCGAQPGRTVVKYGAGTTGDRMTESPFNGTAALYGSSSATPDITYPIDKGDDIGFRDERTDTGGHVIAVAGDNETRIEAGTILDRTFYWKVQGND